MPRPSLTDEQRRETRRLIRTAAATLHAENGMKDISVRAIAKTAGVSVGTVYAHYSNLTELMQSLWKEPVKNLIADLTAISENTTDPVDKLTQLINGYLTFAIEQQAVYRGSFMFVRPESYKKPEPVALEDDRLYSLFHNTIIEGQRQGLFRAGDSKVIAQNVWAGLHGAIALPINIDRLALTPSNESASNMIELLLEWLKP